MIEAELRMVLVLLIVLIVWNNYRILLLEKKTQSIEFTKVNK